MVLVRGNYMEFVMNEVQGIQIRNLAVYHPDTIRDNTYYMNLYKGKSDTVRNIAEEQLGREKRYVIEPESDENTITMAVKACKMVLEKESLTGKDIDIICFSTMSSEYVSPPGALIIHNAIGGKEKAFCYDLNANCVGMVFAFEQLSKYLAASTGITRALIVGAECLSMLFAPEDIMSNICYGDAACAVLLEKTEDTTKFVDTFYYGDSELCSHAQSPICGLSRMFQSPKEKLYYSFHPSRISVDKSAEKIMQMLEAHHLSVKDVKMFCVSQFAKPLGKQLLDEIGASEEQRIYIGDRFGYTGANSPFICLYEAMEEGKIHRGDYILMWTLGASTQYIISLFRY